jgi:hypothetical protein
VTLHVDIADNYVDPVRDGYDLVVRVNPKARQRTGRQMLPAE